MSLVTAKRPEIVVRKSFSFVVVVQLIAAVGAWLCHDFAARIRPDVFPEPWPILPYCVLFVASVQLATAFHESGHVIVGRRFGWSCARICLGSRVAVLLIEEDDTDKTYRQQLAVSAAGPAGTLTCGILLGAAALLSGAGAGASPFLVVAGVSVMEGVLQLVVPTPNSDATNIWRCLRAMSQGRGRGPYGHDRYEDIAEARGGRCL